MARGAALLALAAGVATHAAAVRAVNVGDSSRARGLRGLQESVIGSAAAASASSSDSSGSVADIFEVLPYAGDCPSVRTLVGDCNVSVQNEYYNGYYNVTCVVGPGSSSEDGNCDSPYSPTDWFDYSATDASWMEIEAYGGDLPDWMLTVCVHPEK